MGPLARPVLGSGLGLLLLPVVLVLVRPARGQVCDTAALQDKAQATIRSNYDAAHGWTVPAPGVAPYLSSTDSLFAAYACSHFDVDLGIKEVLANLDGQWASGIIPRIRFPAEAEGDAWLAGTFFPGPGQWQAPRDSSPAAGATAGLAAPPWHALVAMQLFNARRDDAGLRFLEAAFLPLYRYHKYLHEERDAGNHLVYSYHPWEASELPYASPLWTEALKETQARIAAEGWEPAVSYKAVEEVPGFPGPEIFEAELYLMELLAAQKYADAQVQASTPFLAVDVEFNSILAAADVSLAAMAKVLQLHSSRVVDDTMRGTTTGWASTAATRLEYLWAGDRYATYLAAPRQQPAAATVKEPQPEPQPGPGGITSPAKRAKRARGLRHRAPRPAKAPVVKIGAAAPPPPPPSVPLAPGAFLTVPVASSFFPLLPGGLSPPRFQGLLFQIITPGIQSSFDCQGQTYRLPTSGCAVEDPQPAVSALHNFVVQRGLVANGDAGFNAWLRNETVALLCGSSMDPFLDAAGRGPKAAAMAKGPFPFARFFGPVDGKPLPDPLGAEAATLAAALVFTLLNPDAPPGADTPPISHDVTFALVVIELIIAFATGVGCFLFSLSLFRRLSKTEEGDEAAAGAMASMLHVVDDEEDEEEESGGEEDGDGYGQADEDGRSAFGGEDGEGEAGVGGEAKQGDRDRPQRQRQRAGKGTPGQKIGRARRGVAGGATGTASGGSGVGQYQTFRGAAAASGASETAARAGGGVMGAVRSAAGFVKFW